VEPGDQIGPYRIERRLGEGGIGEVFQAFDELLARDVAIKRLRPELAANQQLVARFRAEAQTLARLNHPNIATLYALENAQGSMFMVMEYVEGDTIASLLRSRGALPLEPMLRLAFQALDAVGYAHARGVIHRDIKGSNLMLDGSGTLKVMDFGIARVLGGQRQTRAGQLVGTPEFMAPEQIRGEDADERSDLYSLAIVLFSLLSGRAPFRARSEYDLMKAQIELSPPSLLGECPGLPREIDEVLQRALAKAPDDRFQSAAELRAALEPLTDSPTPAGQLVWPQGTPRIEAETSLLPDTGADPDAATLERAMAGSDLSLIDGELLPDALQRAEPQPEPAPTVVLTSPPRRHRGPWGRAAWLAALGFGAGIVIGLDVLRIEPGQPPATLAPSLGADMLDLRIGADREPDATPVSPNTHGLRQAIFGPNQSVPSGAIRFDLTPAAREAQAGAANDRSESTASPRADAGRAAQEQGDYEWVIRRE